MKSTPLNLTLARTVALVGWGFSTRLASASSAVARLFPSLDSGIASLLPANHVAIFSRIHGQLSESRPVSSAIALDVFKAPS